MEDGRPAAVCRMKMCCLEETAFNRGFVDRTGLLDAAERYGKSSCGACLRRIAEAT